MFQVCGGELACVRCAGGGAGTGAGGVLFGVEGGLQDAAVVPVRPACGLQAFVDVRVDKDDARVVAPRATEEDAVGGFVRGAVGHGCAVGAGREGEVAVADDVAGGFGFAESALRGDVARGYSVELGFAEDGGGVAEDVIDCAFDVVVGVELATPVGEERVLIAEEATVFEDGAVCEYGDCYGLSYISCGIFKGEIGSAEAVAQDFDRLREEGAAALFCEVVRGDDGVFRLAEADER